MDSNPLLLPTGSIVKNDRKIINAWAMYDWANSAYALVIVSAIFPAYYNSITTIHGRTQIEIFGFSIENTAVYSMIPYCKDFLFC